MKKTTLAWAGLLLVCMVSCQGTCEEDEDCNKDQPCCSGSVIIILLYYSILDLLLTRFGYCGNGEGFCTPSTRTGPAGRAPTRRRSGAGCSLQNTEIVGGDLPVAVGGGGIKLDRAVADECFNR